MNHFDQIKHVSEIDAKARIKALVQSPDTLGKKVSFADACYLAIRDAVKEAMPAEVDALWCIAMLSARQDLLSMRVVQGAPVNFSKVFKNVVASALEGELETELRPFALACVEEAKTASSSPSLPPELSVDAVSQPTLDYLTWKAKAVAYAWSTYTLPEDCVEDDYFQPVHAAGATPEEAIDGHCEDCGIEKTNGSWGLGG